MLRVNANCAANHASGKIRPKMFGKSGTYDAKLATTILGGTWQVGSAAGEELPAIVNCREVLMITRKPMAAPPRVRNVVLDTAAPDFAQRTAALARAVLSQGPTSAVSCKGGHRVAALE